MPPSSGGRGGVVTVNLIFSIDVKKFEQRGGLFEILYEQWIYNIHRSLYQTARNMYWGSFFHLSCPPGKGALFTYLVKYESGVGSKRARGSWPLQILQV